MKCAFSLLVALSIGMSACSIHRGIKPIEPEVGHYSPVVVDSLTPTFRWHPLRQPDTRYDLGIFQAENGKSVYYREGLTAPEHTVEDSLQPGANYLWSVRFRRGTVVGPWANYNHTVVAPIPFGFFYHHRGNLFFPFKTPDKPGQAPEKTPETREAP
jgi:hypothetical protein